MKIELTYLEASQLCQRQNLVGSMFGEKLKYAISRNILKLTSLVKEYRNIAMSQKNDYEESFLAAEKKFNDRKLEGEELSKAKTEFDEKHKKFYERRNEIEMFRRELTNKGCEYESYECAVADIPQDIRSAMNVEQELYLISIGVLTEPIPPSAGLIAV